MSHDWSEIMSNNEYIDPHALIVNDVQEIAVRNFIYRQIGEIGTFVLHFDDLKYSFPTSMVRGTGCIMFESVLIRYEVTTEGTTLRAKEREKLVAFVLAALDKYMR